MDGMKAKLIKLENGEYDLLVDTNLKNLSDTKLSLTNCEAIERGYDLDELAKNYLLNKWLPNTNQEDRELWYLTNDWSKGVVTIIKNFHIELMGDKKFSEQDGKNIFAKTLENAPSMESHTRMISDEQYRHSVMDELYDRITKLLQQTEWDVEIEMWFHGTRHKKGEWIPKLDENGCLILKRV